jgi:hypothetical protein
MLRHLEGWRREPVFACTGEVVALLSRPESELPPALASRPGTQPPAGVPVRVPLHFDGHICQSSMMHRTSIYWHREQH